jgi:hypothetical protein
VDTRKSNAPHADASEATANELADYWRELDALERERGRRLTSREIEGFTVAYYGDLYFRDLAGCEDAPEITYGQGV